MKKIFEYIGIFTFLFIFGFIGKLDAVDDDYLFYCDYELKDPNMQYDRDKYTYDISVYVYKDKSVFYHNDNEIRVSAGAPYLQGITRFVAIGVQHWTYSYLDFSNEEFYNTAVKDEKYVCPIIKIEAKTDTATSSISNNKYYRLSFSRANTASGLSEFASTSGLVKNPNSNINIDDNLLHETFRCPGHSLPALKVDGINDNLGINYYMNSAGEKWIEITLGNISPVAGQFVSGEGAEIQIVRRYADNIPVGEKFKIMPEDENKIFYQNPYQKQNNTFSCPTVVPSICENKNQSGFNNIYSSYGKSYVISFSENVNSEYCTAGTSNELVDKPLAELDEYLNQIISEKDSTCTQYLGSASEEGSIAEFLDEIYTLIKIGSILLVIVLSMMDFTSSVTKTKDDLMEVIAKGVKRLIILIIILLLPTIIDLVGTMLDKPEILCGIK